MGEYADLSLEENLNDVFRIEKKKIDSNYWITKDGEVIKISHMSDKHLKNVDNMFKTTFKKLINIKIEKAKRRLMIWR